MILQRFFHRLKNDVNRRSRRFSVFRRSFIDNGFKYSWNLHFIKEVEEDANTLLTLSTGLVRCVNKNLLDELVYNCWCQFSELKRLKQLELEFADLLTLSSAELKEEIYFAWRLGVH